VKINEVFRTMYPVPKGKLMFKPFFALCISLLILTPGISIAQFFADAEAWERDEAWRAAASVETAVTENQLNVLAKAGDDTATLNLIMDIESNSNWPVPAREQTLFEFVQELRQQTPRIIGEEVVAYLSAYQSKVLVPHEDHPRSSMPLFNIKGAMKSVENGWTRQEAAFDGAVQLSENPEGMVQAFVSEQNYNRRQGFLDALRNASASELKSVSEAAMLEIEQNPDLIELAVDAALLNEDLDSIINLARTVDGPYTQTLFSGSVKAFSPSELSLLLKAALENESSETAALAIAQLAPDLSGNELSEDLLFNMLADPDLGSSAALALVANPNDRILSRLDAVASNEAGGIAASRARLALQIHESHTVMGAQR
jgi:hypothetical protein